MIMLDAGSGYGIPALYLAKEYPKVEIFGLDILDEHVSAARLSAKEAGVEGRARFVKGSYLDTGFEDSFFDAIFLLESSCHTNEKRELLLEMYRILKPGGCLVIFDYILKKLCSKISKLEYEIIKEGFCVMSFLDESVWEMSKEIGFDMDTFVDVTPAIEFGIEKNSKRASQKLWKIVDDSRAHYMALVCVKHLCDSKELFYGILKLKKPRT